MTSTTSPVSAVPAHLAGLDLVADSVVVVDYQGRIVWANSHGCRLTRSRLEDLVGMSAAKKLRLRTDDGSDWWASADPLAADHTLNDRIAEQELNLIVTSETRAVALTGAWLHDIEGVAGPDRRPGLILTLRRADARRRRDAARSDLVSTVSHELRSPLTSVKGFTKTLLAKWDRFNDEQKKQMLATVNEDADRVTRLLGELLAVSRIDAGRLQLKRQMVRVDVLAARVAQRMLAGVADGRDLVLDVPELPPLYADPDRVEQILTNLVENAVKYTGGTIRIGAHEEDDHIVVTVADEGEEDGEGIGEEHLRAIFTKFFRRPGEKKQGTGLGLYITKGLVEAHGGEVWASSTPGAGSTFTFTLPKGGLELAGIDLDALRSSTTRASTTRA